GMFFAVLLFPFGLLPPPPTPTPTEPGSPSAIPTATPSATPTATPTQGAEKQHWLFLPLILR
ncbi:MAG: hypothetical protein ACPGWR_33555, partial [Ardenticatenaceae bacterium]